MEIRRLLYFARIAEDGSLTKAAGVLRVAQPALSRQLRLLEEELGVTLFTRGARGMRLTAEGEYLRDATAGPLRSLETALHNVRSLSSGVGGELAIGMPSSLGAVLATPFVRRMSAQFPHLRLRVVEGPTGSLIDWLNRGMIDFALLEQASQDDRLTDALIHSEPLLFVGAPASGLRADRPISFKRALQFPLVVPSHHMGIRATLNRAAMKARMTLPIRLETDSVTLMLDMVADGQGYGFAPALLIARAVPDYVVVSIGAADLTYEIFLSAKRSAYTSTDRIAPAIRDAIVAAIGALKRTLEE